MTIDKSKHFILTYNKLINLNFYEVKNGTNTIYLFINGTFF